MSICLNMIVKNEEENIGETLLNLVSYIKFDYWVISDTGSTDKTMEIITTFFKERNIPGELHQDPWEDFGTNRTKALEYAYNKTDYLFIFDADDKISGKLSLTNLRHDKYLFLFGPYITYFRPLLVNNRKKWSFIGVLHEYIECSEPHTTDKIQGDYFIISGRTGNRNKNPNKYRDDAIVLANAFEKETVETLASRYAFYCAQSYRDAKMIPESIVWYKKVLDLNNWAQEKYYSCIQLGSMVSLDESIGYFLKSIQYDEERIEGVILAMQYFQKTHSHLLVNMLYMKFKDYTFPENKLFLSTNLYSDFTMEFLNSISAYYSNNKISGYESCKKVIFSVSPHRQQACANLRFYMDFMKEDAIDLLPHTPKELWKETYEKALPYLTQINTSVIDKIRLNRSQYPSIFLSYAHTGNMEKFKNTIHSILNTWNDADKVEYWFCASNMKEGRGEMKKYKWIQQEFSDDAMTCIHKKLKELKPTYWIHIENAIFYHKMNYVIEENVQIKFAKNETNAFSIMPMKYAKDFVFESKQWPHDVCNVLR